MKCVWLPESIGNGGACKVIGCLLGDVIEVLEVFGYYLRYVVPTGRVKVPAGRYVVPTGKDNVIVSAGRSKVIPAGRTILVL
ncbi:hypothetical protein Tco_0786094, partial [Tanacetum coccineum]